MVATENRAFRHKAVGRIFPGRPFTANNLSYPANWLELATEGDLESAGIEISDNSEMTPEDLAQEDEYQKMLMRKEQAFREQFEFLGRYVQAYELMIQELRFACVGLTGRGATHQRLMNVIFNHKNMSSNMLRDLCRSLAVEVFNEQDKDTSLDESETQKARTLLTSLSTRCGDANDKRNDILHATWLIGWHSADATDFSAIITHKGKATGKGLQYVQPVSSKDDLIAAALECEALTNLVRSFRFWILCRPRLPFDQLFILESKVWRCR